MTEPKEVELVGGEKVLLAEDSVCTQNQTFLRVGENTILGIVNTQEYRGIYIWRMIEDFYSYMGDIRIHEQKTTLDWHVVASNFIEIEERSKHAEHIIEQAQFLAQPQADGFRLDFKIPNFTI